MGDESRRCNCSRRRRKSFARKENLRLRQSLIGDDREELFFEPYMQHLQDEYAKRNNKCPSGVEIPWEEIQINVPDLKDVMGTKPQEAEEVSVQTIEPTVEEKPCSELHLPWEDIMITSTVQSEKAKRELERCDSSIEIPWPDILFDPNIKFDVPVKKPDECMNDEVEIPWSDLLVPKNIVIMPNMRLLKSKPKTSNKKCSCSRRKR